MTAGAVVGAPPGLAGGSRRPPSPKWYTPRRLLQTTPHELEAAPSAAGRQAAPIGGARLPRPALEPRRSFRLPPDPAGRRRPSSRPPPPSDGRLRLHRASPARFAPSPPGGRRLGLC